jgi:hypothetical protein
MLVGFLTQRAVRSQRIQKTQQQERALARESWGAFFAGRLTFSYGNSDGDKRELLKDVSALVNTHGGHLVIGIDAPQAAATSVLGFRVADIDAEVRRLHNIIRTGIEPPIVGLRTRWVQLGNGNHCVLFRVPQSWNLPHRVSFHQSNKFFIRHSTSVDQMSIAATTGGTNWSIGVSGLTCGWYYYARGTNETELAM